MLYGIRENTKKKEATLMGLYRVYGDLGYYILSL